MNMEGSREVYRVSYQTLSVVSVQDVLLYEPSEMNSIITIKSCVSDIKRCRVKLGCDIVCVFSSSRVSAL